MQMESTQFKAIVNNCRYTECDNTYSVLHLKSPNMYGVHYVTKCSEIYYNDANNNVRLNPECFYFFPANVEFSLKYAFESPKNHYHIYWLSLLARPGLCTCVMEYKLSEVKALNDILPFFKALTRNEFIKDQDELPFILNSFTSTLLAIMNDNKPFNKIEHEQIEKVIFYIYQNLSSDLSTKKLAEVALLNRSYFYKLFNEQLKLPPHKYVTEIKILKAKELLSTGCKMSEISRMLGFSDEKVFSRFFKNFTGLSPSQFKKTTSI